MEVAQGPRISDLLISHVLGRCILGDFLCARVMGLMGSIPVAEVGKHLRWTAAADTSCKLDYMMIQRRKKP